MPRERKPHPSTPTRGRSSRSANAGPSRASLMRLNISLGNAMPAGQRGSGGNTRPNP